MFQRVTVGALALLLAACAASRPPAAAPQPRAAAPQPPAAAPRCADDWPQTPDRASESSAYRVDEDQSELRVLVYRAGPMARLGHNHVLVNRALCGEAYLPQASGTSAFWLQVPVARFIVDDSLARTEEGSEFVADVPEDAKAGTLEHMLGTSMLDAEEFPLIRLRGTATAAAPGAGSSIATIEVSIAGHESTVEVPVTLRFDGMRLLATGSVNLRQTALGLVPYSLMLGALQVRDLVTIKFKIAARLAGTPR